MWTHTPVFAWVCIVVELVFIVMVFCLYGLSVQHIPAKRGRGDQHDGNRPFPYNHEIIGRLLYESMNRNFSVQNVPFDKLHWQLREQYCNAAEGFARMILLGDAARSSLAKWPLKE